MLIIVIKRNSNPWTKVEFWVWHLGFLQLPDTGFTFQTCGFSLVVIGAMWINIAVKQLCIHTSLSFGKKKSPEQFEWLHTVMLYARLQDLLFALKVTCVTKQQIEYSSEQQHAKLAWFCQLFITTRTVRWPCHTLVNACSVKVMFVCWMSHAWNTWN